MKTRVVIVALVLLVTSCGSKKEAEKAEASEAKPVVEVTLGRATTENILLTINAPATIFAREQANVAGRITAPIRHLLVRKGDNVRAGQVLAELENVDILAQRAEAQGGVANAEATLQKTIAGTLPTDVDRARGQVETTKAALNQAQQIYKRRQELFDQGAIPQKDLIQSQTDLATAQANSNVAQRAYDLLLNQSRGRDEQIAKANLEQAQARLQGSNAQLQFTEVRAPFNGIITEQFQYPGDMAQSGTPMFTIVDLSSISARAQVPEASASSVQQGKSCSFRSIDNQATELKGRVTVVNRSVDSQRRTVEVWCEVARPPASIRAGMFGTVYIQTGQVQNAVLVPKAALQLEEGTDRGTVFVVDAKRIAHKQEVTVGEVLGDRVRIASGIKPNDTVVVDGSYGLPDNVQVTLKGERKPEKEDKN